MQSSSSSPDKIGDADVVEAILHHDSFCIVGGGEVLGCHVRLQSDH